MHIEKVWILSGHICTECKDKFQIGVKSPYSEGIFAYPVQCTLCKREINSLEHLKSVYERLREELVLMLEASPDIFDDVSAIDGIFSRIEQVVKDTHFAAVCYHKSRQRKEK